jgi:translation initiation factor IF-1
MPGLSARSANKNVSRAKRAAFSKNNSRIEGALTEDLEGYCTFGKIFKNFGNGRFLVIKSDKREHLCSMRGSIAKAIRPSVDDVVLLSIRDYETRSNGVNAVYDIIASLDKKAVGKLIKAKTVPRWMNGKAADVVSGAAQNDLDEDDIFDYDDDDDDDESDADESTSNNITKKDKKNHRNAAAGGGTSTRDDDSDVDVDAI